MKRAFISSLFTAFLFIAGAVAINAQTSVAGEWDAMMNTPGGSVPLKLIFVVDGEKLTGTAKRSRCDVALVGTVKGSDIAFSYTIDYNGNPFTVNFAGKVDGDKINGVVTMGSTDESWSATRATVNKPKS